MLCCSPLQTSALLRKWRAAAHSRAASRAALAASQSGNDVAAMAGTGNNSDVSNSGNQADVSTSCGVASSDCGAHQHAAHDATLTVRDYTNSYSKGCMCTQTQRTINLCGTLWHLVRMCSGWLCRQTPEMGCGIRASSSMYKSSLQFGCGPCLNMSSRACTCHIAPRLQRLSFDHVLDVACSGTLLAHLAYPGTYRAT